MLRPSPWVALVLFELGLTACPDDETVTVADSETLDAFETTQDTTPPADTSTPETSDAPGDADAADTSAPETQAPDASAPDAIAPDAIAIAEPSWGADGALVRLGLPSIWATTLGGGTLIAVVDTGFEALAALEGRLVWDPALASPEGGDPDWHGTPLSHLVAAPLDGEGLVGVCPGCRLLPIELELPDALDDAAPDALHTSVPAALDAVAERIRAALAHRPAVLLFGFNLAFDHAELRAAVAEAVAADVVVVAPVGNGRGSAIGYPAAYPDVVAVAATRALGDLPLPGTSLAPGATIAAPGAVLSLTPDGLADGLSGTSAAAAIVAGVAALARAVEPEADALAVRQALRHGAAPLAHPALGRSLGYGAVHPAATLARLALAGPDLAATVPVIAPRRPVAGASLSWGLRVTSAGRVPYPGGEAELSLEVAGAAAASFTVTVPSLAPGQAWESPLGTWQVPADADALGELAVRIRAAGDDAPDNDTLAHLVAVAIAEDVDEEAPIAGEVYREAGHAWTTQIPLDGAQDARADLVIEAVRAWQPATSGAETLLALRVRNVGAAAADRHAIHIEGDGAVADDAAAMLPILAPGEVATLDVPWIPIGTERLAPRLTVRVLDGAGAAASDAWDGMWALTIPSIADLAFVEQPYADLVGRTEVKLDVPARRAPGRRTLPLLVFVPEVEHDHLALWSVFAWEVPDPRKVQSVWGNSGMVSDFHLILRIARVASAEGSVLLAHDGRGWPRPGATFAAGQVRAAPVGGRDMFGAATTPTLPTTIRRGRWQWIDTYEAAVPTSPSDEGSHVIYELPFADAPAGPRYVFAAAQGYVPGDGPAAGLQELSWSRVFRVETIGPPDLGDAVPGLTVQPVDMHFHSILEWTQIPELGDLSPYTGEGDLAGQILEAGWLSLYPAKVWGGPLAMAVASAHTMGFLEGPELARAKGRLVLTDHNAFYATDPTIGGAFHTTPAVGPWAFRADPSSDSHPELRVSPSRSAWEVTRHLLGRAGGQEVTLAGGDKLLPMVGGANGLAEYVHKGHHLLLLGGDRPLLGPWHGGQTTGVFQNPLTIAYTFADLTTHEDKPVGFAAHPRHENPAQWSDEDLDQAAGFVGAAAVHTKGGGDPSFVFKGVQVWNTRTDCAFKPLTTDFFSHINPFAGFARSSRPWLAKVDVSSLTRAVDERWLDSDVYRMGYGLPSEYQPNFCAPVETPHRREEEQVFRDLVRKGLVYRMPDRSRIIRKIFGVSGSDAHGDFNGEIGLAVASVDGVIKTTIGGEEIPSTSHVFPLLQGVERANAVFDLLSSLANPTRAIAMAYVQRVLRSAIREALNDGSADFDALDLIKHYITDGSFGKTYTAALLDGGEDPHEATIDAIASGRSVMTDGPLIYAALDVQPPFDSDDTLVWDEYYTPPTSIAHPSFDRDGRIGGAGPYDQGRTALYPVLGGAPTSYVTLLGVEAANPPGHDVALHHLRWRVIEPAADREPSAPIVPGVVVAGDEISLEFKPEGLPRAPVADNAAILVSAAGEPAFLVGGDETPWLRYQALSNPIYVAYIAGSITHQLVLVDEVLFVQFTGEFELGVSLAPESAGEAAQWNVRVKQFAAGKSIKQWAVWDWRALPHTLESSETHANTLLTLVSPLIPVTLPFWCLSCPEGAKTPEGVFSYAFILEAPRAWGGAPLNSVAFLEQIGVQPEQEIPPDETGGGPDESDVIDETGSECTRDADCGAASGPCRARACVLGHCVDKPADQDEVCQDLGRCVLAGTCKVGTCVGDAVMCEARRCQVHTGCDAAGTCLYDPAPKEDEPCDDAVACTSDSVCRAGQCVASTLDHASCELVLGSLNAACTAARCEADGCHYAVRAAACDYPGDSECAGGQGQCVAWGAAPMPDHGELGRCAPVVGDCCVTHGDCQHLMLAAVAGSGQHPDCVSASCEGGVCALTTRPAGTACRTNDPCRAWSCTESGRCTGGLLVEPVPEACQCQDEADCVARAAATLGSAEQAACATATCQDAGALGKVCIYAARTGGACDPAADACWQGRCAADFRCLPVAGAATPPGVPARSPGACEDGNVCTTDVCAGPFVEGADHRGCVNVCPTPDEPRACGDGGQCQALADGGCECSDPHAACGAPGDCDDGDGCTAESCDSGRCGHTLVVPGDALAAPQSPACTRYVGRRVVLNESFRVELSTSQLLTDDNLTRHAVGAVAGCSWDIAHDFAETVCAPDDDRCTTTACDPADDQCKHTPIACAPDSDLCTTTACDPADGQCRHTPIACAPDSDLCTTTACDPADGQCRHTPIACAPDDDACTTTACDPLDGQCRHTPITCAPDADPCTTTACNPASGQCTHTPITCAPDGDACTTTACNPVSGQCTHTPITCTPDGDACTTTACDPGTGQCLHTPISCAPDADPCTTTACDASDGQCKHTPVACVPDDDACTTTACDAADGQCKHTPLICTPDDDLCTDTACDPVDGQCKHTPTVCTPDDDLCTDTACDASDGQCKHTPLTCVPDDDLCTDTACDPVDGQCKHTPIDCDDLDPCTADACLDGTCSHPLDCLSESECGSDPRCMETWFFDPSVIEHDDSEFGWVTPSLQTLPLFDALGEMGTTALVSFAQGPEPDGSRGLWINDVGELTTVSVLTMQTDGGHVGFAIDPAPSPVTGAECIVELEITVHWSTANDQYVAFLSSDWPLAAWMVDADATPIEGTEVSWSAPPPDPPGGEQDTLVWAPPDAASFCDQARGVVVAIPLGGIWIERLKLTARP